MSFEQTPTVVPEPPATAAEALKVCELLEGDGYENEAGPLLNAVDWTNLKAFLTTLAARCG
jgi:hypothetical protein